MRYKQKLQEINEQHTLEINSLNEIHSRIVDEIKQEYSQLLENLKEAKKAENMALENASTYTQHLHTNIQLLESNSKFLTEINSKIEREHNVITITREETLRRKEEEIKSKIARYKQFKV